ncbi:class I SAM-dependent methyltransferase [Fictibacillus sp. B-59209]|uniref:class I SAM-dependent methyltransferase n=1 Tax=Fictibacillus sp. B-59209 TaxID=3024873 RepID=UPI002E1B6FC4|nr:class I SAM-dependent methyltransferase [Fictibacillus sp. B-59209]
MNTGLKQQLRESYDKESKSRNGQETQTWKVEERRIFADLLLRDNKKSLLDLGAGPGRDSLFFHQEGLSTLSLDLSPEMVGLCREKGLAAEVMSFDSLVFADESFDAAWALNSLLHVPKSEIINVLEGIKRVLRAGGLFFMGVYGGVDSEGVWEGDSYDPKRFFSFFTNEDIQETVSSVFHIERFHVVPLEVIGGSFSFQSLILRK